MASRDAKAASQLPTRAYLHSLPLVRPTSFQNSEPATDKTRNVGIPLGVLVFRLAARCFPCNRLFLSNTSIPSLPRGCLVTAPSTSSLNSLDPQYQTLTPESLPAYGCPDVSPPLLPPSSLSLLLRDYDRAGLGFNSFYPKRLVVVSPSWQWPFHVAPFFCLQHKDSSQMIFPAFPTAVFITAFFFFSAPASPPKSVQRRMF